MEPSTTIEPESDALWRVCVAMDRLLSLLPTGPRAMEAREPAIATAVRLPTPPPPPAPVPRPEDLAIQEAIDEVLEYHRTHRPKNTARNYEPKQKEWKVSPPRASLLPHARILSACLAF